MRISIGFNQNENASMAATAAIQQACHRLGVSRIDMLFVLATPHYAPSDVIESINQNITCPHMIGCATPAIFLNTDYFEQGVATIAIHSERVSFETTFAKHLHLQSPDQAADTLMSHLTPYGMRERVLLYLLADGTLENVGPFKEGLASRLAPYPNLPMTMGISSSGWSSPPGPLFYGNETFPHGAIGFTLAGETTVTLAHLHGYKPIGKPRYVTQATGATIHTIDDRPAIELYKNFFGDHLALSGDSPSHRFNLSYPLGVTTPRRGQLLIRNVRGILDDGSIVCDEPTEIGRQVHLMISNADLALKAGQEAALQIKYASVTHPPTWVMINESLPRYTLLRANYRRHLQAMRNIIGNKTTLFGFVSGGGFFDTQTTDSSLKNTRYNNDIILIGAY